MSLNTLLRVIGALDTRETRSVSELLTLVSSDTEAPLLSRRTIERTLVALEAVPSRPVERIDGSPQRWRLRGNTGLAQSLGNDEQHLQQQLTTQLMRQLLPTRRVSTLPDAASPDTTTAPARADGWQSRVLALPPGIPRYPQPLAEGVLEAVGRALRDGRQLHVDYRSRSHAARKALTLHPQGLVQDGYRLTLIAVVEGYEDLRQFSLQRIERAQVLAADLRPAPDFNLENHARRDLDWPLGEPTLQRFRIHRDRVIELEELPIAEDQWIASTADADGFHEVRATLTPSMRLEAFFLSYGEQLRRDVGAAPSTGRLYPWPTAHPAIARRASA